MSDGFDASDYERPAKSGGFISGELSTSEGLTLRVLGTGRESGEYTVSAVLLTARSAVGVDHADIQSWTAPTRREAWASMWAWVAGRVPA